MVQRNKNHKTCKNSVPSVRHSHGAGPASLGENQEKGRSKWGLGKHLASFRFTLMGDSGGGGSKRAKDRGSLYFPHFLCQPLSAPSLACEFDIGKLDCRPLGSQDVICVAFPSWCAPTFVESWPLELAQTGPRPIYVLKTLGYQKLLPDSSQECRGGGGKSLPATWFSLCKLFPLQKLGPSDDQGFP